MKDYLFQGNAINFSVAEMSTGALSQSVMASNMSNIGYTEAVQSAALLAEETSALKVAFEQILQDANIADFSSVLDTVDQVELTAWVRKRELVTVFVVRVEAHIEEFGEGDCFLGDCCLVQERLW